MPFCNGADMTGAPYSIAHASVVEGSIWIW